ncbi:unnamed protein product [Taenia asiatica]|uniref:RT_RNaseH_2 domain-containing protein n=1 Tax=Taenia asiatica TaxID=60517 RepID=A0A0R3WCD7_TAEAS|nr:unnamed protein product [Taenia asiatica]
MDVTEDRIKKVRTWLTLTDQTRLRSFLGLVKGFAKIASPLHQLTEKQAKTNFKWENQHDEVFKELRRMLYLAPILALPNSDNAPPLCTRQRRQGRSRGQKDREHVIAYASIRLNKNMRQKSATGCDQYAIYKMVRHFKLYPIVRQLIVRTGHQAPT